MCFYVYQCQICRFLDGSTLSMTTDTSRCNPYCENMKGIQNTNYICKQCKPPPSKPNQLHTNPIDDLKTPSRVQNPKNGQHWKK